MDDLKLYSATENQLENLINLTESISNDMKMTFGIQKCKILHIQKGKWSQGENIQTNTQGVIETMVTEETYKYLGVKQNTKINQKDTKEHLVVLYKTRLKRILRTKLNAKNLSKAVNTYAVPVLTYSFGIIKWTDTDLDQLNRMTRTLFSEFNKHHPKSCVERFTIPRKQGGRGIIDIKQLHYNQIKNLREYFWSKNNKLHTAIKEIDKNYTPLKLAITDVEPDPDISNRQKIEKWSTKELHGRHYNITQQQHIDKDNTYMWLEKGDMFPETEGFAIAIQDQVINTLNYRKYIIKEANMISDKCRKCHTYTETIDHITSGCTMLAGTDYVERHNNVAKIVYIEIVKLHKLVEHTEPYFKYQPPRVLENNNHKIYWDNTILTDKTIVANRPDITLVDKQKATTYLIDISIPNAPNIQHKYNEKIEKYTPLATEVQRIWKQEKVVILPLIISPTGITPKTLKNNLERLSLPSYTHYNIQKAAILKTCNLVRKFLNIENQ